MADATPWRRPDTVEPGGIFTWYDGRGESALQVEDMGDWGPPNRRWLVTEFVPAAEMAVSDLIPPDGKPWLARTVRVGGTEDPRMAAGLGVAKLANEGADREYWTENLP